MVSDERTFSQINHMGTESIQAKAMHIFSSYRKVGFIVLNKNSKDASVNSNSRNVFVQARRMQKSL